MKEGLKMDYREFCAFKARLMARQEEQKKPGATWRVSFDWRFVNSPAGEEIVGAWWLLKGFFFWRDFFGVATSLQEIAAGKRDYLLVGPRAYRRFVRRLKETGLTGAYIKIEFLGVREVACAR